MLLDFALPDHERQLIPEGRISGPMPWVIAIMMFLTLLSAIAGLLLVDAAQQGSDDLSSRITVQIIEPDPSVRAAQRTAISKALQANADIESIRAVPDAEVRDLLEPWLGGDIIDADIAIPALVDVTFKDRPDEKQIKALRTAVRQFSPSARIDSHAVWMAPYLQLMRALLWLAAGVIFLLLLATSAAVILAVRSALNTHRETINIMHMLGGTDIQAARLFQRRVALDSLLGGLIGFVAALIIFWFLAGRFSALGPGMLTSASMPWYGWIILALIPLAVTGLAMLMARWTVVSALRKML
ncbi:cell division protein FtsX [Sphingorhabdus arenilitoris]|uniref:Cell division protein FtsX n=1 Tax=Sphingorhabdus arenilitoris TaxID=1490041 RepID=A0ABV8RK89_9SPHN